MRAKPVLIAIILLTGIGNILAQNNSYTFNTIRNGNEIYCISMADSFLLTGTSNGVIQRNYDGEITNAYNTETGLINNIVNTIFTENNGRIWFASPDGLHLYHEGNYLVFDNTTGLFSNTISSICSGSNGDVWVANYGGLSRFNTDEWVSYPSPDTIGFNAIIYYSDTIWCTTDGFGLVIFDGENWSVFNTSNTLPDDNTLSLHIDTSGVLWFATADSGLIEYNGEWIRHYDPLLENRTVNGFIIDKNNTKWILTTTGIIKLTDDLSWSAPSALSAVDARTGQFDNDNNLWLITYQKLLKYTLAWDSITEFSVEGLLNNGVTSIHVDTCGQSWIGTRGGISIMSKNNDFTNIAINEIDSTLTDEYIIEIEGDSKNNVWVSHAYSKVGLAQFDGNSWTSYNSTNSILNTTYILSTIAIDSSGYVWTGSQSKGVQYYNGLVWSSLSTTDGLINNNVRCIVVDRYNNKWIGTQEGVSKYDGSVWENYDVSSGLINNEISCMAVDSKNNIWTGTYSGLSMYDGTTWHSYTVDSGMAQNFIRAIAVDNFDNILCGHQDAGMSIYDAQNKTWSTYNTTDGLSTNQINAIATDFQNRLLVITSYGISIGKISTVDLSANATSSNLKSTGNIISIPLSVKNFKKIKSLAFSLHFDQHVLKYNGITNGTLYNIPVNAFDTTDVQNGTITFDYVSQDILCQSLDDNSTIFYLNLEVVNPSVDSSEIVIDNNPTSIEIENINGVKLNYRISSFKFKIDNFSGTEARNDEELFFVYPNPAADELTIKSSYRIRRIVILDTSGRIIRSVVLNNENTANLNIQDLIQGIYLVKVENEKSGKTFMLIKR